MQEKKKFSFVNLLLILIFMVGLGILLYPNISDFFNQRNSSKAVADYDETVAKMDEEKKQEMIGQADTYNETLLDNPIGRFADMTDEQQKEYDSELNVDGDGMMCYLKIDKLGLNLPVYHGTTEDVLQHYVGHVEGTSLPTGGKGTHCGLSGHRGLPNAVLFTNIDRLEKGDYFTIIVLGEEHVYKIDQILTVLPDDLSPLEIDPEKDYCTLITCTPYGVNTHRLMIRGVRVPDDKDDKNAVEKNKKFQGFTREQIVNMVAIGMTGVFAGALLWFFLFPAKKKRKVVLRPWDDNIEKVIASAIKVSEAATRANWEVENITQEADKLAKLRRWDDTLDEVDAFDTEEKDGVRSWKNYDYINHYDDYEDIRSRMNPPDNDKEKEDEKDAREWADDVLEKVDQDWEPLDREGHKNVMRYAEVKDIYERGKVDEPPQDLKPYFEKEIEKGKEIVEKSKNKK